MKNNTTNTWNINKIVFGALFIALICAATMSIRIPSPTGGYVNAGDCFVLLSGFLFGPQFGFLIAGLGSAMADILAGYVVYGPATFIIKGLTAALAGLLYKKLQPGAIGYIISGIAGEFEMVIGYFFFTSVILGQGLGSLASIPGDTLQGIFGIVVATYLIIPINKYNLREKIFSYRTKKSEENGGC